MDRVGMRMRAEEGNLGCHMRMGIVQKHTSIFLYKSKYD